MRNSPSISVYIVSIVLLAGVCGPTAGASDTVRVELDMFSGRPNPVCTLSDSQDVAVIKNRMAHYEILSALSWPGCPQPRSGLGYRGVKIDADFGGPLGWVMASGGSLKVCPRGPDCGSYCDYRCELERMTLRACERENLIAASIRAAVPDSLFLPVSCDGLFTLQQDQTEAIADFSLMRSYQIIPPADTLLVQDVVMTTGADGLRMTAYFGVIDKGLQPGFNPVTGTQLDASAAQSARIDYRNRFDGLHVVAPTHGYQPSVILDVMHPGHLYIVRTSEGGLCAMIVAGQYIGGINRFHFYYLYTSENSFGSATAASKHHGRSRFPVQQPFIHDVITDLQGRIIRSDVRSHELYCFVVNGRIDAAFYSSGPAGKPAVR